MQVHRGNLMFIRTNVARCNRGAVFTELACKLSLLSLASMFALNGLANDISNSLDEAAYAMQGTQIEYATYQRPGQGRERTGDPSQAGNRPPGSIPEMGGGTEEREKDPYYDPATRSGGNQQASTKGSASENNSSTNPPPDPLPDTTMY